jgi:hypothetical protein
LFFVKLRSELINYDKLAKKLNGIKDKVGTHDEQINFILKTIELMTIEDENESKEELGFKID